MEAFDLAASKIRAWREDPVRFVRECIGAEPDEQQMELLHAFPHKRRIATKACKGPGKTCGMAWCAWNFLVTRPHPKIPATSISGDNLRDGLWTEMAKWQNRSPLLKAKFEWTAERIFAKDHPTTWWMSARTWSRSADKTQQSNTLAGLHEDYMLFLLDESGGIPDGVMAAAEAGLATGIETKILQAGNPTHLEGPLYRACTSERHLWHLIEITGDPDDPKRSKRIDIKWAREQIERYGRDDPWVLVNVFGRFPPANINSLLGPDDVNPALARPLKDHEYNWAPMAFGIDCARFGDDPWCLFPRQGLASWPPLEWRGKRTQENAGIIANQAQRFSPDGIFIDATGGYGAGVEDALREGGYKLFPVQFGGKATDPRYFNLRTEIWWKMGEWIRGGGSLPRDPGLVRELTAPTYTYKNGRIALEEKDQIKKRLGFSPNKADALATTFAFPLMPKANKRGKQARSTVEYNPYVDGDMERVSRGVGQSETEYERDR